jgi:hypothetical protein
MLAAPDSRVVRAIADQSLDIHKIALAQIRLRCDVKLCVVDTSDHVDGNGIGTFQNLEVMLLGEIRSLKADLLGPMPRFIVLWQHISGKYADQMIDPPVALPVKPDGFQHMMIPT